MTNIAAPKLTSMNVLIPAGLPPCWRLIPSRQPTSTASVSLKIRLAQSLELINIKPLLYASGRIPWLQFIRKVVTDRARTVQGLYLASLNCLYSDLSESFL